MATVRLKDVAAAAGVSVATASRALTGRGRLSAATVEKVARVAERLGYQVNERGRALREGSIRTVGVVVPVISNPFFSQIVQSLEAALEAKGFEMLVADSYGEVDREARRLQMLVARDVEGLVVIPADADRSASALRRVAAETPLVQLDRQVNGLRSDFVGVDNDRGLGLLVDHLASCGARSVVLVASDATTSVGRERRAAFDTAMARVGLSARKPILDRFTLEFGTRAGRLLAGRRSLPDAVVAGDDLIAIGVIRALTAQGVRVPADVMVTGFDGTLLSEVSDPTLTTVRQPYASLTRDAVELLLSRASDGSRPVEHRRLPPELVVAHSTQLRGVAAG
jgi:LacI family transcriptional regulator